MVSLSNHEVVRTASSTLPPSWFDRLTMRAQGMRRPPHARRPEGRRAQEGEGVRAG
jgi:hypothetical protein